MAEYVDKAEVLKHCSYYDRKLIISEDLFLKLPAIDVSVSVTPDIVHCAECKHIGFPKYRDNIFVCNITGFTIEGNDYCSRGERKE